MCEDTLCSVNEAQTLAELFVRTADHVGILS
jgi:hypothetical protein